MIITLITDFGKESHYIAAMKGVILSICPEAKIVDITHNISPQDIEEAAFILDQTYQSFPKGTIHTVVVDPGVGTVRKPLIVKTSDYFFITPDNGVLAYVFKKYKKTDVYEASNKNFWRRDVSSTFHGRDIFAPVAAHLASGVKIEELGTIASDYQTGSTPDVKINDNEVIGKVVYTDRFGNCITNIPADILKSDNIEIKIKDISIEGLSKTFSSVPENKSLAYTGSSGLLEIGINMGSAEKILGITRGTEVIVKTRRKKGA